MMTLRVLSYEILLNVALIAEAKDLALRKAIIIYA